MGIRRLGISNPTANTATTIFTADDQYLMSVVATNLSGVNSANIRVWVEPSGSASVSQYAFIVYDIPVDQTNSYETFRFAVNQNDLVRVQASSASISFQAYGLVQYDVKLGIGTSSYQPNPPSSAVDGMIWVDSNASVYGSSAKPIYIYNSASGTWDSTAASAIDTSANYTWTGINNFSASTSIGNISATEIDYLNNASANIQTQLNSKAPIASPTFTGTTTASVAVVQGNLTVDTNTLFVDSINNRVGIGTSSPQGFLDISSGNEQFPSALRIQTTSHATSRRAGIQFGSNASSQWVMGTDGSGNGLNNFFLFDASSGVGLERMRIDASGRVSTPYQPMFSGRKNSSGYTGIWICNETTINRGNHYNTSTGYFTCPVAGAYAVFFQGIGAANAGYGYARILVNGVDVGMYTHYSVTTYDTSRWGNPNVNGVVSCSVNDTIAVSVSVSAGNTGIYPFQHNTMSIIYLG